jgi:uncharacterized membrane protein YhdT
VLTAFTRRRVAVGVTVCLQALVVWMVTAVIRSLYEGLCGRPATVEALADGRTALWVTVLVSLVPWVVVAAVRRRAWPVVAGVLATSPAIVAAIASLSASPSDWTGQWCLF